MGFLRARKRSSSAAARGRTFAQRRNGRDGAPEYEPRLPHEHDQSVALRDPSQTGSAMSQERIEQATNDLEHGRRDTERRGIPSDVPTDSAPPGSKQERAGDVKGPRRGPRSRFL